MKRSTKKTAVLIMLAASSVPYLTGAPGFLRVTAALAQAFFLPGIVALVLLWKKERSWLDDVILAPIVSPVILTLMLAALQPVTGSYETSLRIAVWVLYALLALALVLRSRGMAGGEDDAPPLSGRVVLICAVLPLVLIAAYMYNRLLLYRSDAWMHASIVNEIISRGFPPLEPRLPDVPIRYMWFYHLFQASWTRLSGLGVFWAMAVSNAVNAFIFPWLIFRLVSFFTDKKRHLLFTPVFAIAGLQSASWIFWPVILLRAATGEVKGLAEIKRILSTVHLNSHEVIFFLRPYYTFLINPIDKFFTTTTFNYATDLFLLVILIIAGFVRTGTSRMRTAAAVFVLTYGAFLFHVVTGIVLIMTICGAGLYMFLADRIAGEGKRSWFSWFGIPAAAVLAGVAGIPYFLSLTGSAGGQQKSVFDYLHLGTMNIATIAAPIIVLFPFARRGMKRLFGAGDAATRFAAGSAAALLLVNLFVDLPGNVEGKFTFLLFIFLIIFIAPPIIDWAASSSGGKRAWAALVLAVLFVFPVFMTIRGFVLDRPRGIERKLVTVDRAQRELFDWIRTSTSVDAVIIERNDYGYMPVYALRHEFAMPENFCIIQGYGGEKVLSYTRIRDKLYSSGRLTTSEMETLAGLGRDLYLVVWSEDLKADPDILTRLESMPRMFNKVFENRAGTVFSVNAGGA